MKKINEANYDALTKVLDHSESKLWAKVKRLSESYKSRYDAYADMMEIGKLATAIDAMRRSVNIVVEE